MQEREKLFMELSSIMLERIHEDRKRVMSGGATPLAEHVFLNTLLDAARICRPSESVLDKLVGFCLEKNNFLFGFYRWEAVQFAEIGASRKIKEELLEILIRAGDFVNSEHALRLLGRSFTENEVLALVKRITKQKCSYSSSEIKEDEDYKRILHLAQYLPPEVGQTVIKNFKKHFHDLMHSLY